jgi:CubicO group peptidase (beta-lactamase class C family)
MASMTGAWRGAGWRGLVAAALTTLYVAPLAAQGVMLTTGAPDEVGMSAAVLQGGVGLYREAVERGDLVGAVLLVARHGKIVLHEAVGSRNWESNLPMEKNTIFRMASNTKPVVATGAAILVEGGKLSFADPVRKHIPSFDNYRAGFITLGNLLSHTSGFRINTLFMEPYLPNPTLQREAARFGDVGAAVTTGTTYSYSNPGFNTAGALVEIASGQLLDEFLRANVYRPLGMSDTYHMEVADKLDGKLQRMGAVYYTRRPDGKWTPGWKPGDPPQVPFVRASGGLISTAPDYAIFLQMFLNGGIYGNTRILKEETVKLMTSRHTPAGEPGYGYGWSLDEEEGIYSHGGSDGTFAWVDPARDIIGLVFTQTPSGENPRDKFMEMVKLAVNEPRRER